MSRQHRDSSACAASSRRIYSAVKKRHLPIINIRCAAIISLQSNRTQRKRCCATATAYFTRNIKFYSAAVFQTGFIVGDERSDWTRDTNVEMHYLQLQEKHSICSRYHTCCIPFRFVYSSLLCFAFRRIKSFSPARDQEEKHAYFSRLVSFQRDVPECHTCQHVLRIRE